MEKAVRQKVDRNRSSMARDDIYDQVILGKITISNGYCDIWQVVGGRLQPAPVSTTDILASFGYRYLAIRLGCIGLSRLAPSCCRG